MKILLPIAKLFIVFLCIIALVSPWLLNKQTDVIKQANKQQVIKPVKVKPEKPLHDVQLPKFSEIRDIPEKKRAFFDFLRPAIIAENAAIRATRKQILAMKEMATLEQPLSETQEQLLQTLVTQYKVSKKFTQMRKIDELIKRVDIIPTSLILVQAANESAWGTSRFARIGLNFFGIWCYKKGCGMVPNSRDNGANHEVAAFSSVKRAVQRYIHNINTNNAYMVFRTIRSQLREQDLPLSPQVLATGLLPYSERGTDYVLEITAMIRQNQPYLSQ